MINHLEDLYEDMAQHFQTSPSLNGGLEEKERFQINTQSQAI